jgi:hypothetical protein
MTIRLVSAIMLRGLKDRLSAMREGMRPGYGSAAGIRYIMCRGMRGTAARHATGIGAVSRLGLLSPPEIQAFFFDFLCPGLAGLCRIWLSLDSAWIAIRISIGNRLCFRTSQAIFCFT